MKTTNAITAPPPSANTGANNAANAANAANAGMSELNSELKTHDAVLQARLEDAQHHIDELMHQREQLHSDHSHSHSHSSQSHGEGHGEGEGEGVGAPAMGRGVARVHQSVQQEAPSSPLMSQAAIEALEVRYCDD